MRPSPRKRVFAGERARALRGRHGLNQTELATRIGLSVSYLSQIESNDRPMTDAVLMAFARAFPDDWADTGADDTMALLAGVENAVQATVFADAEFTPDAMRRAVNQQPLLARHLVAVHAALARSQEQLRSLDDALDSGSETVLPWEEVRDWFHASGNYIDAIDRQAEGVATELAGALTGAGDIGAALTERLGRVHGVTVENTVAADRPLRSYDAAARLLSVDPSLPNESRLFLLAHQLMRLELAATIAATIGSAALRSEEAFQLLSIGLANYAAGALLMPYARFRAAARELRHDIDALRLVFGVSFEQACHRLSTLQRPGATGIPFFFCRVDMAGNITKRHSATRLQFARFGGACPLWIVHEAVAIPDRVLVQLAETPDGVRYVSMAKGLVKPSGSYARPSRRYAVALGCEIEYAADFIYGDQLDVTGERSATPIGVSCRICPRRDCEQRAFPPAGRHISVDPDHRGVVPYTFD